jgi:cytochrome d ubiquinol oxidase subunit II
MVEHLAAAALFVSLVFYALTGGADYGGGIWDLLARGERASEQRKLIARAIGPVWEANHVWLILALVILFTAFPSACALLAVELHVPLTLMLLGVVLRGAAFTFRAYDRSDEGVQQRWGRLFAIASIATPVLLGAITGAIVSGRLDRGPFASWFAPFPLATGVLALAIFAHLAACYLAVEAEDAPLREDFRRRALASGGVVAVLGAIAFALARNGAPVLFQALESNLWSGTVVGAGCAFALAALGALAKRRVALARLFAIGQVVLMLLGWALAQYPCLLVPGPTIFEAAAPRATLILLVATLALGAVVLFPALAYLFSVFKGRRAFQVLDDERPR